jgi:acetyl esterase/lipase
MIKKLSLAFASLFMFLSCCAQTIIPLYDSIPNSKPAPDTESSQTDGILRIRDVSIPTLTIYTPTAKSTGAAVIICPGGGYSILAFSHEGTAVAEQFAGWGITAFVLKYRLPDDSIMVDKTIGPLQDAQRAIQLVRQRSREFKIDPRKIGIMGFSAGGHLASTASTHFLQPVISNNDKLSLRPDFSILIYPVISLSDSLGHIGSRNNLLGKTPSPETIRYYSNELQVTAQTPPAFLVHAYDDATVKVENSIRYKEALEKNKVPVELRLYEKGGHGFGMHNKPTNDPWMNHLRSWLKRNKLL